MLRKKKGIDMQAMRNKKEKSYGIVVFIAVIIVYHLLMREYIGDSVEFFRK